MGMPENRNVKRIQPGELRTVPAAWDQQPEKFETRNRKSETDPNLWEPRLVAFFCNWCTYTAADLAGVSRMKYASNVRVIRLMCSGRVDPQFILEALARGADGVLLGGCHPSDCHYLEGNYKMLRRFELLQRVLAQLGLEPERVRLEWISAAEGEKVKRVINEMSQQIRELGPLRLPQRCADWDREAAALQREALSADEAAEAIEPNNAAAV
jgi:F420-non-reducing hydrogenase iron-sulfur subunit